MRIEGRFFDGLSSRSHRASVVVEKGVLQVEGAAGETLHPACELDCVEFSSRVGDTPRFLRFSAGASFETADNDAVDQLLARRAPASGLAHRLESKLRYALVGLAFTVAFVWACMQWGVPALARVAAHALPVELNAHAETAVLELLDRQLLKPSRLPAQEQARLLAVFAPLMGEGCPVRVVFRDAAGTIGPNALALPAGTIIFTDQFIQRARHDEELIGVLAHEIGHVAHRHAMRASLQASFMGLLSALVVGDISSVSSAVTALPLLLTQMGYSRDFEREADRHAVDTLRRHGISPQRLVDILERVDQDADEKWGYLSTHPPTPERVRLILSIARE
ncbi:M48 family metallopeptidase [Aromatoleum petrolei]|uniref:M48 family metalloprotease n=1 Tax=Aromatoleum petrolei TaxID=76116 RepID=A0ABX1MMJ8_9RHOO|nr:M48 family metallopeptidase [Aromatoleum petrolei]NMF88431.1 M48 family metalloprotease [Aromatoleum petrolei]QTQ37262.1 Peptidase M48 family protein [Aromatoleum petrolei]